MSRLSLVRTTVLAALLMPLFLTGCIVPENIGVAILVTPSPVDFGLDDTTIEIRMSKNVNGTTLEPVVVTTDVPWLLIGDCTEVLDNCLSIAPINGVDIPLTVDRSLMQLGTNRGTLRFDSGGASPKFVEVFAEDIIQVDFTADRRSIPSGGTINFTDLTVLDPAAGAIVSRTWAFGDGTISTDLNPSHRYVAPGAYEVSLTVVTTTGTETFTKTAFIIVGSPDIEADFTAVPRTVTVQESVAFTDNSTSEGAPITSWFWEFGDGGTSTQQNPTWQYSTTGVFDVTLTVTNVFGNDVETKQSYVIVQSRVAPTADFVAELTTGFMNEPLQFYDRSEDGSAPINRWVWDFGDGTSPSTDENPTHIFTDVGIYTVTLTVYSDHGSDTISHDVEITYRAPIADFEADKLIAERFETVNFTDLSIDGTLPTFEWDWDFGDGGTSNLQNPDHFYNTLGTFDVSLTVRMDAPFNNEDSITKEDYILVIDPPVAAFDYNAFAPLSSDSKSIYTTDVVQFTNISVEGTEPIISFAWDFDSVSSPGSEVTTLENPTHIFPTPGTYVVEFTVFTATRSRSVTATIVVDSPPSVNFTADETDVFALDTVTFTDQTTLGTSGLDGITPVPIDVYDWDFGDTNTSALQNPTNAYADPGVYDVSLEITFSHSDTGAPATQLMVRNNYINVSLPDAPIANFNMSTADEDEVLALCIPVDTEVTFNNHSDDKGATDTEYYWDFGDGNDSTAIMPTHTYTAPGVYTVTLTVTTGGSFGTPSEDTYVIADAIFVGDLDPLSSALSDYITNAGPGSISPAAGAITPELRVIPTPFGGSVPVDVYATVLTSQEWRDTGDYEVVNQSTAEWRHRLLLFVPDGASTDTALLWITGGNNLSAPNATVPASLSGEELLIATLAASSGSAMAILRQVPNQAIEFSDEVDLRQRFEDDIIAYTFDEYLKDPGSGDEWPLLLPMVKSATSAMDAIQDIATTQSLGFQVDNFVVAGASKRGWTSWLAAAVDNRVSAVVPFVIDVLNMDEQMAHHIAAYGWWAPAIYSYAQERIFGRFDTPEGQQLLEIVDPFSYRCNLTMPKYMINATGDQFFVPDSSQWYFPQLPGDKFLNYVPNDDHGMGAHQDPTDPESVTASLLSFYMAHISGTDTPRLDWQVNNDGSMRIYTEEEPLDIKVWRTNSLEQRDFRLDKGVGWVEDIITNSLTVAAQTYNNISVAPPSANEFRAYFVQVQFPNPADPTFGSTNSAPFTFTTPVQVLPRAGDGSNVYQDFNGTRTNITAIFGRIPFLQLHGTPAEMGEQYGRLMAAELASFVPALIQAYADEYHGGSLALARSALDDDWAEFSPLAQSSNVSDEITGISTGSGISMTDIRRINMILHRLETRGSAVAAVDEATPTFGLTGNLYQSSVTRLYDNVGIREILLEFPCVVAYIPGQGQGFPHVSVTFAGMAVPVTGVSAAGMALSPVSNVIGGDETDEEANPVEITKGVSMDFPHTMAFRDALYFATHLDQPGEVNAVDLVGFETSWREAGQRTIFGDGRMYGQVRKLKHEVLSPAEAGELWTDFTFFDEEAPLRVAHGLVFTASAFEKVIAGYEVYLSNEDKVNIYDLHLDPNYPNIDIPELEGTVLETPDASRGLVDVIYNVDSEIYLKIDYSSYGPIEIFLQNDVLP